MSEETSQSPPGRPDSRNGGAGGPAGGNGLTDGGPVGGDGEAGNPVAAGAGAAPTATGTRHLGEGGLNLKPSGRVSGAPGAAAQSEAAVEDPVFSCRQVSVFYRAKQALKEVTLDVGRRQVLALIGPSGCGKSTFLRCLNRMNDTIPGARVTGSINLDG